MSYNWRAVTAHAAIDLHGDIDVTIIEHDTPVKSHPLPHPSEPTPSLPMGTGIHAAFNIITSNCELHHGLSAYAHSKEQGHNSMLAFCRTIQDMEAGMIGAGVVTTRRVKSQKFECFYDELAAADALTDTDMSDRWGHEGSSLPKLTYGFNHEPPVIHDTTGDGYSRLPRRERFVRDPRTWALVDTWR